VYPLILTDDYNPLLHPDSYRAQTLKDVNFYFSLLPWIDDGIVEVIRTPTDFDPELNLDLIRAQKKKFEENAELKEAARKSVEELGRRHRERMSYETLLLGARRVPANNF
jgi:hypothetical protein